MKFKRSLAFALLHLFLVALAFLLALPLDDIDGDQPPWTAHPAAWAVLALSQPMRPFLRSQSPWLYPVILLNSALWGFGLTLLLRAVHLGRSRVRVTSRRVLDGPLR